MRGWLWGLRFFFFTLVTGPTRSLRLKLSDTRVYAPQIRTRLGTTAHFCEAQVVVLNFLSGGYRRADSRADAEDDGRSEGHGGGESSSLLSLQVLEGP